LSEGQEVASEANLLVTKSQATACHALPADHPTDNDAECALCRDCEAEVRKPRRMSYTRDLELLKR